MSLLVWNGQVRDNETGGKVPEFFYYLPDNSSDQKLYCNQFVFQQVRSHDHPVVFLNQVCGYSLLQHLITVPKVSVADQCFQCDPNGPDSVPIPSELWSTIIKKGVPGSFPDSFNTKPGSHFRHAVPHKLGVTDRLYRRRIFKPKLLTNRNQRSRGNTFHGVADEVKWMDPPRKFNFERQENHYRLVYVEDSKHRVAIKPGDRELVGIPFIHEVKE